MAELGYLGAPIWERWGGAGMDYTSLGILCEELERADTAFRVVMSVHVALNSLTLMQWATEEQKQRWLVPQARGEKLATFGLTEPDAGTDVAAITTTARRDGDSYVLNGSKLWISLADIADHFLVFATVDRSLRPPGHHGVPAGAGHGRAVHRHHRGQAGHPCRQHRFDHARPGAGARGAPHRRGGRGLRHRHERHRPGPLHGRHGFGGPGPGVPRRVGQVRPRAHGPSARRSAATSSSSR